MSKRKARLKHGTRQYAKPVSKVTVPTAPWQDRPYVVEDAVDEEVVDGQVKRRNPNNVKRARIVDMLETYHKKGVISRDGFEAGKKLRNAWDATQKGQGNDWSREKVDSSPKPDSAVVIQITRLDRLKHISKRIPNDDWDVLFAVACEGRAIGHLRQYRGRNHPRGITHLHNALERLHNALS